MSTAVCLILALYSQQPQTAPQGDRTIETVSLHALRARTSPSPTLPFGTLLMRQVAAVPFLPQWEEPGCLFDADQVRGLLAGLQAEAAEKGQLDLEIHGDNLFVSGAREPVTATVRAAAQLAAFASRPIQVTATLLEWSDAPPPAVLGPDELKNALAQHRALWQGKSTVRGGARTLLRNYRRVSYVRDVDVAIAQHSNAAVPVMDAFFEGTAVGLEVHGLAGSQDLVLFAQFAIGQRRGDVHALLDGNALHPALDVPDLDSLFGTMSGRIVSGGAIALHGGGHPAAGPQRALVLSARYATPPVDANLGNTVLLPVSALTANALTASPRMPPITFRTESENEYANEIDDTEGPTWGHVEPDGLIGMVHHVLGEDFEQHGGSLSLQGPFLVVTGPRQQAATVEAFLVALQDRWLVNGAVRATVAWRDTDATTPPLHDVTVPVLQGRTGVLFRGRETTSLAAMNLEVAQEASIHDPKIDLVQSGLWMRVRLSPGASAPHAELSLLLRQAGESRRRPLEPARIGDLSLIDVDVASWEHQGSLFADRDLELGDGPAAVIDGRARATSVRVRGFR